jgi:hypothetical protein
VQPLAVAMENGLLHLITVSEPLPLYTGFIEAEIPGGLVMHPNMRIS